MPIEKKKNFKLTISKYLSTFIVNTLLLTSSYLLGVSNLVQWFIIFSNLQVPVKLESIE